MIDNPSLVYFEKQYAFDFINEIGISLNLITTPEDINKFIYYVYPPLQMKGLIKIDKFIGKSSGSTTDKDAIFNTIFKPILYHVVQDKVVSYPYAEVVALKNLPTFLACLSIMNKKTKIKIPRVLQNVIIGYCVENNQSPYDRYSSFKKINEEDIVRFKKYCEYVQIEVSFGLKFLSLLKGEKQAQHLPHYKKFSQMYEALKK